MWTMLGDMYGHPVHSNIWDSTNRFCYCDNYHPEFPKLLTGDVRGKLVYYVETPIHSLASSLPYMAMHPVNFL